MTQDVCRWLDCMVKISPAKNKSGFCKPHYNADRNSTQIRLARLRGQFVEMVHRSMLLERDTTCHLCGFPLAEDAEVDHVIPLALGGLHSYDNTALTCRSCNRSKNCRLLPSARMQIAMAGQLRAPVIDPRCRAEMCDKPIHRSLNRSGLCRLHANRLRAMEFYAKNRETILAAEYASRGARRICRKEACGRIVRSHNKTGWCREHRLTTVQGRLGLDTRNGVTP